MVEKIQPIKTDVSYVLICCCTCKRPKMLMEALKSINTLILPKDIKVEALICDNDAEATGEQTVKEFSQTSQIPIHYFVEKERGIASARNRVLTEALNLNASHILFFDDDELLEPNCLIEHIKLYQTNLEAYISSGPTPNKFIDKLPFYVTKHMVFKQRTTKKTGLKRDYCASGNVFFPLNLVKDYNIYFSLEYKFMGGEDGDFFGRASKNGFTIIWNNEAIIYEMVSKARGNVKWILNKCYYNGFAGATLKFKDYKKSKTVYLIKQIFNLILNGIILIPSILGGPLLFLNVLGVCFKTKGKIDATIKTTPLNFYQNISGE